MRKTPTPTAFRSHAELKVRIHLPPAVSHVRTTGAHGRRRTVSFILTIIGLRLLPKADFAGATDRSGCSVVWLKAKPLKLP
jgi:hypothetical protein